MVYIKRIASIVAKGDNQSGGNKKAGLVCGTDFNRIPRSILLSNTTNKIETLDCMLRNCKRVKDNNGVIQTVYMPFTRTRISKTGKNNTFK